MCAWHTVGTLVNAVYILRYRQPLGSVFSSSRLYSSAPAQATSHCVNLHSCLSLAPDFPCPVPAHITSMASHHPWEEAQTVPFVYNALLSDPGLVGSLHLCTRYRCGYIFVDSFPDHTQSRNQGRATVKVVL